MTKILAVLIVTLLSITVLPTIPAMAASPVIDPIGDKTVNEGKLLTFTVTASDPDGDPVTLGATGLPSYATFDSPTGVFAWTPSHYQAGEYTVVFWADDETGGPVGYEIITITVINVNGPAVWNPIGDKTVNEGELLTFTVTASDPDGDPMTMWATNLPDGATFSQATPISGLFSWTPTYDQAGSYTIYFVVSTDLGGDLETVTITVGDVNGPPVLDPIGDKTVLAGELLTFTVTASDPDGDSLMLGATWFPSMNPTPTWDPATGVFTWTPASDQAGTHPVYFTASDGILYDNEEITITVKATNAPPALDPIWDKTVNEGELLTFTVTASDPDGDPVALGAMYLIPGATFNLATGVFTWTPTFNQAGDYTVLFTAYDGFESDSETITITVINVNVPPILDPIGDKTVNAGQLLTFTVTASDPDGDPVTLSATDLPAGATFDPATGVFTWTPVEDQSGNYSIRFEASDGEGNCFEDVTIYAFSLGAVLRAQTDEVQDVIVVIRILEEDEEIDPTAADPVHEQLDRVTEFMTRRLPLDTLGCPTFNPIPDLVGIEGFPLIWVVTVIDPDGDPVTLSATDLPDGATFSQATPISGLFSWTPTYDQAGSYDVTFIANDGESPLVYTTITITVNDMPTLASSERTVESQPDSMGETKIASPQKPLDKPVNKQIKVIVNKLNSIIHYIEAQNGKHISEYAADLLISALTDILDSLQQL